MNGDSKTTDKRKGSGAMDVNFICIRLHPPVSISVATCPEDTKAGLGSLQPLAALVRHEDKLRRDEGCNLGATCFCLLLLPCSHPLAALAA